MTKSRLYDDSMIEILRDDPEFSTAYLYQAFLDIDEDGGQGAFLMALRHVIEARGGMASIAQKAGVSRGQAELTEREYQRQQDALFRILMRSKQDFINNCKMSPEEALKRLDATT